MEVKKPMTENEKFYGNKLYSFLMQNDVVTKEEMLKYLDWDKSKDRQLRNLLSLIGQKVPLIATSDQKGYKIAKTEKDLADVEHQWKENDSRIKVLQDKNKPLIKFYEQHKYKNAQ
jgi:hypothetical protein